MIHVRFICPFFYNIILHITLPVAELCIFPVFELDHKWKFLFQPPSAFYFQYEYFSLVQFADPVHSVALQIVVFTKTSEEHRCGNKHKAVTGE